MFGFVRTVNKRGFFFIRTEDPLGFFTDYFGLHSRVISGRELFGEGCTVEFTPDTEKPHGFGKIAEALKIKVIKAAPTAVLNGTAIKDLGEGGEL